MLLSFSKLARPIKKKILYFPGPPMLYFSNNIVTVKIII